MILFSDQEFRSFLYTHPKTKFINMFLELLEENQLGYQYKIDKALPRLRQCWNQQYQPLTPQLFNKMDKFFRTTVDKC